MVDQPANTQTLLYQMWSICWSWLSLCCIACWWAYVVSSVYTRLFDNGVWV